MSDWFISPPAPIDRRTFMVVEGTDPWNRYAFARGPIGDHARWWLKLQIKYQRWPWWRPKPPPPVSTVRLIELGPYDRALAWLLTLYAIARAL